MSKNKKPAPIIDRFQLTTDQEIDRHNTKRNQRQQANEHAARQAKNGADAARQKLAPEVIAKYSALTPHGAPDTETLALIEAMERTERFAAATAEHHVLATGGLLEALHHCLPFSQELQKMALDARRRMAAAHMVGPEGQAPTGTTLNGEGKNLLESVVVYSTSRPTVRWVLGDSVTFQAVVGQIRADTHCEGSDEPFRTSLAPYLAGRPDCIAVMAEHAALQRKVCAYRVSELEIVAPPWRDQLKTPDPVSVGLLLPVAFGSDIVVVKLCVDHVVALASKYGIQLSHCGIEEPWESTGNYW
jgi:hypothetical protein